MQQPEARLKKKLIHGFNYATDHQGWFTYLIGRGAQKSGIPDLVFGLKGTTVWIEAKVAPNGFSKLQLVQTEKMAMQGMFVIGLTRQRDGLITLSAHPPVMAAHKVRLSAADNVSVDDFKTRRWWSKLMGVEL